MRDSDTFWEIFEHGERIQARKDLLTFGRCRFGPPDESIVAAVNALDDLERFDRMLERALFAASWEEVLDTP